MGFLLQFFMPDCCSHFRKILSARRPVQLSHPMNGTGFCNCPLLFSLGISVCLVEFVAAITRKMVALYKSKKGYL